MVRKETQRTLKRIALISSMFLAVLSCYLLKAESPTAPPGTYTTSWVGNTFLDVNGRKVVTELLNDVCISPNGHVFTAGYAESWGGGASFNASDGSFAGRYQNSNTGFGDPLAVAVADNNYVYFGSGGGILRASHGGSDGVYTRFLNGKSIQGLYIKNGKLYVSDYGDGKIRILNISTMAEESNFSCTKPTRLTVDNAGNIWVVIYSSTSVQEPTGGPMWIGEKVKSFNSAGTPGPEITDFEKPLSVAMNNSGQLLVGGLNENGQIWKYDVSGTPTKVGTFGADKGIFGGVPGAFADSAKLHWIHSIAVDANDNIYTGCSYGTFWGGVIEKWNTSGKLLWRDFAGTSLDCAGIDPDNETEVYSKFHHYSLDYSKTTPGTEWSLKGFTVNRFKYPNDARVDQNTDVQVRSLGAGAYRIGGKLFVARSRQFGYEFELYRRDSLTDGEVLVPSVIMGNGGEDSTRFYNPTTKTWYAFPKYTGYNQYWSLAKNGDILSLYNGGYNTLVRYLYGGLDSYNNPIWRKDNVVTYDLSSDFGGEGEWCRRIVYDSDEDVLYAGGNNNLDNAISKIIRYNNLSTSKTKIWESTLPYDDAQYTAETSWGGGQPTCLSVAGDYVFILYGYGHVRILNKSDGSLVGTLKLNVNGWIGSGGQVDAAYGMTVTKRITGQYVILCETASWASIMMFRWCPDGKCSEILTPLDSVKLSPDTLNIYGTGTGILTTNFFPDSASNKSVSWTTSNPSIATANGGPNGTCTIRGISLGKCTVTVTSKDGTKTDSSVIIVNNLPVSGVNVLPDSTIMGVGRTRQLKSAVIPSTATIKDVNWISSDTSIVKVNASGKLTGIALGTTYVKAISTDGGFKDSCKVIVAITGDGIKGEYYNTKDLTGDIVLTRIDADINFDYGSGSYADGQPNDNFSVRWTGQVVPLFSEKYTFQTACDDGVRLWVNGKKLVDKWIDQGETKYSDSLDLIKGIKYNIKMEYYENGGGASAHLRWSSPSQALEIIPQDQLYSSYTIIPVTGVSITPPSITLKVGEKSTLTVIVEPNNATNSIVNWSSDSTSIASVDGNGKITAKAKGISTITVTTDDGSMTATCIVTVKPLSDNIDDYFSRFTIFPNPFKNELIVSERVDALALYRIDGVLLRQEKFTDRINTSDLASGIYFVHIQKDGFTSVKKCIKE